MVLGLTMLPPQAKIRGQDIRFAGVPWRPSALGCHAHQAATGDPPHGVNSGERNDRCIEQSTLVRQIREIQSFTAACKSCSGADGFEWSACRRYELLGSAFSTIKKQACQRRTRDAYSKQRRKPSKQGAGGPRQPGSPPKFALTPSSEITAYLENGGRLGAPNCSACLY